MNLPLELIYNLRLLRKNLGFVSICILMIGLGMGLSITMYSIIDNLDTRSLPFQDGDKYVSVSALDTSSARFRGLSLDGHIYQNIEQAQQSFKIFGAEQSLTAVFSDADVSERVEAVNITPNLLQATGVVPLLGRGLLPSDDVVGAPAVALISYNLWQGYYTGREDIIGTISRINGGSYTIVGVMPEGFAYPVSHDLWLPLQLPGNLQPGEWLGLEGTGILADGVSIESARVEIGSLLTQLGQRLPEFYANHGERLALCCSYINFDGPSPVKILLPALTIFLLLLVCLNVANLILVRTNERIHEFSIRTALGATRKRLIQAILQDSLLICLLGSLLGIVLGDVGMGYVHAMMAELSLLERLPFWFHFDWEVGTVITTVLIVLVIWLLSAGLAIWQITRQDLSTTLAGGTTGSTDSRNAFGTSAMVSIEIVFSCFLLIISGVFVGTSIDLADTDYGTATQGYLTGRIDLESGAYTEAAPRDFYRQSLRQELLAQEGIQQVTFTTDFPSQARRGLFYNLEDREVRVNDEYPRQSVVHVARNYFETMDVSMLAGRNFDGTDTIDSLPVVIIDELFAEQLWPDDAIPAQSALGKRIQISPNLDSARWLTVVGVIPHIVQRFALNGIYETSLYLPLSQPCCTYNWQPVFVALKVAGDPNSYRQTLQQAAMRVDRNIPITRIISLTAFLETLNSAVIFGVEAFSSMAFITLALAVTGIFAIVSRSVRQRSKEIGIRRAVGSSNRAVLWVFIKQGLKYLGTGLIVGGGGAVLAANAMNSESIELINWLPLVLFSVSLGLCLLVFIATYSPARLLIAMEPGETLRDE